MTGTLVGIDGTKVSMVDTGIDKGAVDRILQARIASSKTMIGKIYILGMKFFSKGDGYGINGVQEVPLSMVL
jgi:hypothetical protein